MPAIARITSISILAGIAAIVLKNAAAEEHSPADHPWVVYRNAEPVLIDPGYGANGYGNRDRQKLFLPPQQHNVWLVEDEAHPDQFLLLVYPNDGSHPRRIARHEQIPGLQWPIEVLEAVTPAYRRSVILIDAAHFLIVDRLVTARRVRLEWFGHGALADNTAEIDAARAQATFMRGPSLATRVTVLVPGGMKATPVSGEYGFEWPKRDHPLTGINVTSDGKVTHAVTLVEVRSKQPSAGFSLAVQVQEEAGPGLKVVVVPANSQRQEVFHIAADGRVSASE